MRLSLGMFKENIGNVFCLDRNHDDEINEMTIKGDGEFELSMEKKEKISQGRYNDLKGNNV